MAMRVDSNRAAGPVEGPVWYELADDHSVLELRSAAATTPLLALHVVIDSEADATIAWWETENGMWVVPVATA